MATTVEPESIGRKLGIPRLKGHGKFVSASLIDSLGTGLILAFTVVYFARTTPVSLAAIGAAMTLARLLALPTSMIVGPLIDRFTARRTAAWGNLVSVLGYLGFLLAHSVWQIVIVVFLVQVGHTTYWTSSSGLVVLAAPEDRRTTWFGFMTALRNTAMGVGGALAAFAFTLGEGTALHAIVIGNAASYVLAATLLYTWRPAPQETSHETPQATADVILDAAPEERTAPPEQPRAGYGTVLRDVSYTLLIGVNATMVFAQMLIKVLLAIYIVDALEMPAWTAGTLIVVNAIQVSLTQTLVARKAESSRMTRAVMLAAVLNAAAFVLFAVLYVTPDAVTYVGLFLAMVVFTLGEVIAFPALDTLSVSMAPSTIRGRYLATYQLSWTVGEVVAPGLLTFLLARGEVLPMVFLASLSLLAIPLLLALEKRVRTKTSETAGTTGTSDETKTMTGESA
ncbi:MULTISPECIES: MFS transporter [unclassified Streptomyces]|uniref:MFS transporter n=1 Tax=unclassified Streptomyces TaxID=2593676 RepID=UPI0033B0ABB1